MSFTVVFAKTNDVLFVQKNQITNFKVNTLIIEKTFLIRDSSPITLYRTSTVKQDIIEYIFWVFKDVGDSAIDIAKCESGLNPFIIGDHGSSYGLFQLHRPYFENWDDYKYNTNLAYKLYQKKGWFPWTCATKLTHP